MSKKTQKSQIKAPWENPFPFTLADGRVIEGETCRCGRQRSEHEARGIAWGHGACADSGCEQYTFKNHVFR